MGPKCLGSGPDIPSWCLDRSQENNVRAKRGKQFFFLFITINNQGQAGDGRIAKRQQKRKKRARESGRNRRIKAEREIKVLGRSSEGHPIRREKNKGYMSSLQLSLHPQTIAPPPVSFGSGSTWILGLIRATCLG